MQLRFASVIATGEPDRVTISATGTQSLAPSRLAVLHMTVKRAENEVGQTVRSNSQAHEHRPVKLLSPVLPLDRALHTDGYPARDRVIASFSEHR